MGSMPTCARPQVGPGIVAEAEIWPLNREVYSWAYARSSGTVCYSRPQPRLQLYRL